MKVSKIYSELKAVEILSRRLICLIIYTDYTSIVILQFLPHNFFLGLKTLDYSRTSFNKFNSSKLLDIFNDTNNIFTDITCTNLQCSRVDDC